MYISFEEKENLIQELATSLNAKFDGPKRNLLVPVCPYCGHDGYKFGIYVGRETGTKTPFMTHCFSCGHTTKDVNRFLEDIERPDLFIVDKADFDKVEMPEIFRLDEDREIDDELDEAEMPDGWKRCYKDPYLKSRGFTLDDYMYFPVGTTKRRNFKFTNYVVFPIIDGGKTVGYIGRHKWSKEALQEQNELAARTGGYKLRRYNNSLGNDFGKMLYNYDMVEQEITDTVILTEGVFDAISLVRKLDLYDEHQIVPVATFGKKISETQIYKIQSKGVKNVIIGYDSDAVESIRKAASVLNDYFSVLIPNMSGDGKDWDEKEEGEIYGIFSGKLLTPREFALDIVQEI